jgi:hypothetical protein
MKKSSVYRITFWAMMGCLVMLALISMCSCKKEATQPLNQITFDNRTEYQATFDFDNFDVAVSLDPGDNFHMDRVFIGNDNKQYDLVGEPYTMILYDKGIVVCGYEAQSSIYNRVDTTKCK